MVWIPQIPNFNFGTNKNTEVDTTSAVKNGAVNNAPINGNRGERSAESVDLSEEIEETVPKKSGSFFENLNSAIKESGVTIAPPEARSTPTPTPTATPAPAASATPTVAPTKIPIIPHNLPTATPLRGNAGIYKPTSLEEARQLYGERPNMKLTQIGDKFYYVIDTPMSPLKLSAYWLANGMYQKAGFFKSGCDFTARYAAYDLMWGSPTSKENMKDSVIHEGAGHGAYKSVPDHKFKTRREAEEYIYKELSAGHAITIAIEHPNPEKDGDNRHVVTGIGLDPSIKSFEDFDLAKVLVLDNTDGRIKTLEGRKLIYRQKYYHIGAPTKAYINILKELGKYKTTQL